MILPLGATQESAQAPGSFETRRSSGEMRVAELTAELAAAQASERFLRRTLEQLPISISTQGLDLRYKSCLNPLLRCRADQVIGLNDFDLLPHLEAQASTALKRSLIASGRSARGELRIPGAEGTRYFEYVLEALRDDMGGVIGITNILIDVTERKLAVLALAAEKRTYKRLFDNALYAAVHGRMIFVDGKAVDFVHLAVNAQFTARFGFQDAVGKRAEELTPGIGLADGPLLDIFGRVATSGIPERFEMFVASLGEWLDYSVFRPAPGEFAAVAHVITDRKKRDAELRVTAERLTLAQRTGRVGVFDADLESGLIFCTPEMRELFGFCADTTDVSYDDMLACVVPEDRIRLAAGRRDWFASTRNDAAMRFQVVRHDGARCWMSGRARVWRDADNRVLRVIGSILDVTEHRRLESEIIGATTREQQRFALDLHDGLGQDLYALSLLASAAQLRVQGDDLRSAAQDFEQIAGLAAAASRDARSMAHGLAPISMAQGGLISALRRMASTTRQTHDVTITVPDFDRAGSVEQQTADHLYRIVREAVWNAIKHGRASEIALHFGASGDTGLLSITDNGQRLETSVQPGVGIDLMRYRAELIGGELSVSHKAVGGTEVKCSFPLLP